MEDYVKIKVGNLQAGIIGLKAVLSELAARPGDIPEEQIGAIIRERLAGKNYFAPAAAEVYERAFLREYRKHLGLPVAADGDEVLSIKVLGPGCPRCRQLRDTVMQILARHELTADFEYITDPLAIAEHGVVLTPALIVNDEIKASGTVPSPAQLTPWLVPGGDGVIQR
jgi:small redox-active disulfide protein 2